MRTIFGEENFFNKEMAKLYKAQDECVLNEMSIAIKTYMPTVVFDREKLERWVKLCIKLDNIDNTDLISMATAKKFEELKDQLALTEKALELACKNSKFEDACEYCAYIGELEITKDCPRWCETDEKFFVTQAMGYFKEQAKEIMKSE